MPQPALGTLRGSTPQPGSPGDYALRYAALGWAVFPVHSIVGANGSTRCTCGNRNCSNPGKHPVSDLVHDGLKSATTNPDLIVAWWANAPWANVAVRTGESSGFWVLDVDRAPDKPGDDSLAALIAAHGQLPNTAEAITGSGGCHLLWRYPSGRAIANSTGKLGPGLDVRGEGGYIVVEPSRHIGGGVYCWEGSSDPLEGVALADAPEWLVDLVTTTATLSGAGAVAPGADGLPMDSRQILELRQALGYLPADDYTRWVRVGMALHASGAGNQAFGLWNEWSLTSEKYDPKVMRKKWASFADRAGGVELVAIFAMAAECGWVNPANRAAAAFEQATGQTYAEANRAPPPIEIRAIPPRSAAPFPVHGLDALCDWIGAGAAVSYPGVVQQAALCIAAAGAARLYRTPQGEPCSLYFGAASASVGELRAVTQAIYRALDGAALRRLVRTGRIPSPQVLYRTLMRAPACVYLCEDYGAMAAFARRQPSGLQEQVLGLLTSLFDGATIQLDGAEEAGLRASEIGDEQPTIVHPALSLFALVGKDHLATLLRASELGRGALEQILWAIPDEASLQVRDPKPTDPPPWLIAHLRRLRRLPATDTQLDLGTIFQGNAGLAPNLREVAFAVALDDAYAQLDLAADDRRVRPVLLAARGILRRLCAILAAWANPESPSVDASILHWATQYVRSSLDALLEQFEIFHGDNGRASVYDAVLALVFEGRHEGVARRDLISRCWPFRSLDSDKRGKLIEQLLADEALVEIESKSERGRPGKRLVHAKFVKPAGGDDAC